MASKFISVAVTLLNAFYEIVPLSVYYELLLHPLDFAIFLIHMKMSVQESTELEFIPEQDSYIYLQEIYANEGFFGLFRGFHFRLCEIIVTVTITNAVWKLCAGRQLAVDEEAQAGLGAELGYHSLRVFLTNPFHNMMLHSFFGYFMQQDATATEIVEKIFKEHGFQGFYCGMSARLCGEVIFIIATMSVNKLLHLRKRNASSVKEMVFMAMRDAAARRLCCPLQVLYYRMAVLGLSWHWIPSSLRSCS